MNKCGIVKDLLPLYADDVCTPESKKFVAEHLAECEECQKELESYNFDVKVTSADEKKAVKSFKKEIDKKNFKKVFISVIVCLSVILGGTYMLFIPEFNVPYSEDLLTANIPVDEGINVYINLPNYTNVYSTGVYNTDGEIDVYLTVTRNLWAMIVPDFSHNNNFWRTNGYIGTSFQASDDMPFKKSAQTYFNTNNEIVRIHYAEFESSPFGIKDIEMNVAVHNKKATTHLIWSAPETE